VVRGPFAREIPRKPRSCISRCVVQRATGLRTGQDLVPPQRGVHLADPVDAVVLFVDLREDRFEVFIADRPGRRWPGPGGVEGARSDRHIHAGQRGADRLDSEHGLVLLDEVDDQRQGRSSSAASKADADRKIAFARRTSRTSRSNCAIFSASLVLVPGHAPASTSACITQPRSVSALIPSCSPIRTHALGRLAGSLRASNVNLIARSRSSSGYLRGAAI